MGFRVRGSGFRVQGARFRVQGGFRRPSASIVGSPWRRSGFPERNETRGMSVWHSPAGRCAHLECRISVECVVLSV